jgi:replicative DNA helicase
MNFTSDNHDHPITIGDHLQSLEETILELREAYRKDKLEPATMRRQLAQLSSNFKRDFPDEHDHTVTESSIEDLLAGYWDRVKKRNVAAPTGLHSLDMALGGGFQAKRLVTLLGAPGGGKTSLANQIAERVAEERPVLYVTSEDTPDVLLSKTLARIGDVDYGAVLYGNEKRRAEINRAIAKLAERPSASRLRYLDLTAGFISLDELRDRAQAHFQGSPGPGLLVVDYLQRMARAIRESAGVKELREAVTQLTERLRALACELDCCVLAIASMNRASGYGKNGEQSALTSAKESGDIEFTSDVLMALCEDNPVKREISFIEPRLLRIDKNRQGATKVIKLDWRGDRQQFTIAEDGGSKR